MRGFFYFLILNFLLSFNAQATIYGAEDFYEIFEVPNIQVQQLAESVAVLVKKNAINSDLSFRSRDLKQSMVCENEKFTNQQVLSQCTGTLISPKHILSASHCYSGLDSVCQDSKWVFDYKFKQTPHEQLVTSSDKIYSCKKIVKGSYSNNLDYVIIELDRFVTGVQPINVDYEKLKNQKDELFAITAPRGLPLKYSSGTLRSNIESNHFVTNIDLMRGSSGGPIFNSLNGKLVGVVAQGDHDYELQEAPFCNAFHRCEEAGCMGEYATRVSQIPELKDIIESGHSEFSNFLNNQLTN
jgi:V8-like Glu-specific endopeptidase